MLKKLGAQAECEPVQGATRKARSTGSASEAKGP
jgi:hypothetical protein